MSGGWPEGDGLERRIAKYAATAEHNDALFLELTGRTGEVPWLAAHRDWIEAHRWGFGDRAFHAMWLLVARDLRERFERTRALEIGVFKGQVISLWALLSRQLDWPVEITAVSPFRGRRGPGRLWLHRLRKLTSPAYRRDDAVGNLVPDDDHLARCREVFAAFDLDFGSVRAIRGLSGDPTVRERLAGERFELVYIDGDHSYEGAHGDLLTYGPAVVPGGYLVVDDAAWDLPGSAFFKGFEAVARACRVLPDLGFRNVLNVGHNRIFRKLSPGEPRPEAP
jgi:hypothetical protein